MKNQWKPVNLPEPLPRDEWEEHVPELLPKELHGTRAMRSWHNAKTNLYVLMDVTLKDDGKYWRHVSFSFPDRVPTYEEISEVKRLFIGRDKRAVFVLPSEDRHVNLHPYCLHLWHCEDGDGLPEFSSVLPILGRTV